MLHGPRMEGAFFQGVTELLRSNGWFDISCRVLF
jgi:hypothetical protein